MSRCAQLQSPQDSTAAVLSAIHEVFENFRVTQLMKSNIKIRFIIFYCCFKEKIETIDISLFVSEVIYKKNNIGIKVRGLSFAIIYFEVKIMLDELAQSDVKSNSSSIRARYNHTLDFSAICYVERT